MPPLVCGEGGLRPESWEHWPSGDIREEAEAKARMKVPRGSEGSPERTLEASGAKDFKKEVVNRIDQRKGVSSLAVFNTQPHTGCVVR